MEELHTGRINGGGSHYIGQVTWWGEDALQQNIELKERLHTQHPVIASITKTAYSQNIVLVATQHFTAQNLINNTDVIQSTFAYQRIQKDVQWFKTMVHGVAINDFDTITGMSELQQDIEMFNPKLRLATLSR